MKGRIAGIDYGKARIGIALSDLTETIASALTVVKASKKMEETVDFVLEAIKDKEVKKIVIGLPLLLSGKDSDTTKEVRQFASLVKEKSNLPVQLWDERLTSREVERVLIEGKVNRKKRSKHIDEMSAILILQNFLDANVG